MYKLKVKNSAGEFIGEFETYTSFKFGKRLNNYGTSEIVIPRGQDKLSSLVALRQNKIYIYKDDTLVWSGEMALRKGDLDSAGAGTVSLQSFTKLEQLRNRYTEAERIFTAEDQGEIMWTLIDESQDETYGDLGITRGYIEPNTFDRDRSYYNQNILEALYNLSNVISGLDLEITDEGVFNAQTIIGTDRTDSIVLEYGHNIQSCSIIEDFTDPANRAIVLGEATDMDELQRVEVNSTPEQILYGLREQAITEIETSDVDTLEDKGEALIRKYKSPLLKIDIDILPNTPSITDFSVGDLIRLIIKKDIYNIDEEYRVFEYTVQVDSNNVEKLSLVLGKFTI